ncbi:MAG: hypothetical protein ACKN9U_10555, partial [Pirellulaceae bacterium]
MAWLLRPKKNDAGPDEAVQVPGADSAQAVGDGAGNGATVGTESSAASSSPAPGVPSSPSNGVVVKPPEEVSEYIEDPKFVALKRELHQEVIAQLDPVAIGKASPEQLRAEVRRQAEILCRSRKDLLTSAEHERLIKEVMDEAFGLGPLEQLLSDPDISDILIN